MASKSTVPNAKVEELQQEREREHDSEPTDADSNGWNTADRTGKHRGSVSDTPTTNGISNGIEAGKSSVASWSDKRRGSVTNDPPITDGISNEEESYAAMTSGSRHGSTTSPTPTTGDKSDLDRKLDKAHPYNFFLTSVAGLKGDEDRSISFADILLDSPQAKLQESLHLTYKIDPDWLLEQYKSTARKLSHDRITVIYDKNVKGGLVRSNNDLDAFQVTRDGALKIDGCHHSKMSLHYYKDNSLRVVVGTANLTRDDWEKSTQGVWLSVRCPKLEKTSSGNDGDSKTEFKKDLLRYLAEYNQFDAIKDTIQKWTGIIQSADMSKINVFFIGSCPGQSEELWGVDQLKKRIRQNVVLPEEGAQLVVQVSHIGKNISEWTKHYFRKMVTIDALYHRFDFKLIYPTQADSENFPADSITTYSECGDESQKWLADNMYRWKCDEYGRTKIPPHIKHYSVIAHDNKSVYYFLLTSANLSKFAWGQIIDQKKGNYISNFEAGVLFVPRFILKPNEGSEEKTVFPLEGDDPQENFPLPFDLGLIPYDKKDKPWSTELPECESTRRGSSA